MGNLDVTVPSLGESITEAVIAKWLKKEGEIVNKDEVPTDRSFRDAWTVADSDLTDGVGISTTALP